MQDSSSISAASEAGKAISLKKTENAETENLLSNAKKKLSQKKLDLIVANDVSKKDIGFDSDENEVTLITKKEQKKIKKASKKIVSKKIVEFIASKVVND